MRRLTHLADRKMAQGKSAQAVAILLFQKLLTPTPLMGFVLGGIMGVVLGAVLHKSLSIVVGAALFGLLIMTGAVAFQMVHDRYWEREE